MSNKELLLQAIDMLRKVEFGKIEGVSIETNTYQDGSPYITINVDMKE